MGKLRAKRECEGKQDKQELSSTTITSIKDDVELWYKIKVLVYDLKHMNKNPTSQKRTLATTHELYISGPYFSAEEAVRILGAIIDPETAQSVELPVEYDEEPDETSRVSTLDIAPQTVEQVIKARLGNFFEQRRASGDSRPCGPHDMAPIYQRVFQISTEELEDEKFISRVNRSGVSTCG